MFKIGDRVRVIDCEWWHHCGSIATLVRVIPEFTHNRWILDLEPQFPCVAVSCPEQYLMPIDDGNEVVSWSDCVWQTRESVTDEHT